MTEQKTSLIGAISHRGIYGIGRGDKGKLPWQSKIDMNFFATQTTGDGTNDIAMSRGMRSALPEKYCPLPHRGNIIVSSQRDLSLTEKEKAAGVRVVFSPFQAKQISTAKELYFAGGPDIWYNSRDVVDELLINVIHVDVPSVDKDGKVLDLVMFPHLLDPTILWPEFTLVTPTIYKTEEYKDGTFFDIEFRRYVRKQKLK